MLENVEKWLEENNIRYKVLNNVILVPYESTLAMIRSVEWTGRKVIEVAASVAVDVKPSLELFKFLLEKNAQIPFGKFSWVEKGIDEKPTVFYSHYLLEKFLQKEEFETTFTTVLAVADTFGEDIAKLGGGLTFTKYAEETWEKEE